MVQQKLQRSLSSVTSKNVHDTKWALKSERDSEDDCADANKCWHENEYKDKDEYENVNEDKEGNINYYETK